MKWYYSVKTKLLGFFLLVAAVFLTTIVIIFSIIKEDALIKQASQSTTAATSEILRGIKNIQGKMEERVLTLASVAKEENHNINVINAIFSVDKKSTVVSGGVWFEPYAKSTNEKDHYHFFQKTQKGVFKERKDYDDDGMNYRDKEFYRFGKSLKEGETFWTKVYLDPHLNSQMITIVAPIYKNNKFIGVANLNLKIESQKRMLFWESLPSTGMYLLMIDREGTIIGKSPIFNQYFTKEKSIHDLNHPMVSNLFTHIKPGLSNCKVTLDDVQDNYCCVQSSGDEAVDSLVTVHKGEKSEELHGITSKVYIIEDDPILKESSVVATYHFPVTHWKVVIGIPEDEVMAHSNITYKQIIIATIIMTILATIFGYFLLKNFFIRPIESINKQLKNNLSNPSLKYKALKCNDHGEIGTLVENLNARTVALEDSLCREAQEIQKRMLNEKLLIQQSKMAAMGEMMDAVAHQWKQPLNALSMYSDIIKSDFEEGLVDKEYVEHFRSDIQFQIDHMVTTLDEFRSFFRPNKEDEEFELLEVINAVLFLTKDDFLKNRITPVIQKDDKILLEGSSNEFKHVLLNLFGNARDAFIENDVEDREITMRLIEGTSYDTLEVEDNAGGIPEDIIDDIFDPHVTTKEEGKGTGIGLYMSKRIAEKYGATLSVHNTDHGACFVLKFKKGE